MQAPPALRHAEFRRYLLGTFVSNVGNSVQVWAIAWQVYHLTNSSYAVGALGLFRVVPLLIFSLIGGVIADQADRRKVMLTTQSAMAIVSLILLLTTTYGVSSVWPLYGLVAVNAVARSFDGPARQALFVGLVPTEHFPNAASLNGVTWRLSDVLGPVIAGVLIASTGFMGLDGTGVCYALNFASFFAVIVAVWMLPPKPPVNEERATSVREVLVRIHEGWRFVNRSPVVRHSMWIDFWATLLSGAEALLPAFAGAILKLGPQGYGILAASTGTGALIAAGVLSVTGTVRNQGKWVVWMIAAFGLATVGFGLAPNLWVAALCLAGVGAADMTSTVFRQTIRQLATPDALRGRMNATASLFHISGPQLGDFEAGLVAHWWGERVSIVLGGSLCLLVAAHWSRARALVDYKHEDAPG